MKVTLEASKVWEKSGNDWKHQEDVDVTFEYDNSTEKHLVGISFTSSQFRDESYWLDKDELVSLLKMIEGK